MNAVEFDRVSKTYAIYDTPSDRLRELALLGSRSCHRDFPALSDLSFSIRRGEVFCIVGENGSGKSTTLQLMAGIMQPTSGEVRVHGRVSALLELGAGFNPEFSGRENVLLNASILGLSGREIAARYPDIEAFAGIGDFIDRPVKTYSSGMVVRLAFAVAIHVDPEILLVDEALAVGDAAFRRRCLRKVHELRARGTTIVFVSHSIADVRAIGERVLWLEHGRIVALGDADTIIPRYLAAMAGTTQAVAAGPVQPVMTIPNIDHRHGDGSAEILGIALLNEYGETVHLVTPMSTVVVRISLQAKFATDRPEVGFVLRNHLGLEFSESTLAREGVRLAPLVAGETVTVDFELEIPELYPGAFSISPWIANGSAAGGNDTVSDWIDNAMTVQMARGEGPVYGYIHWPCRIEFNSHLDAPLGAEIA